MEEDNEESGLVYPVIENVFSNGINIKSEPVDSDEDEYEESIELAEYGEYEMQIPNKIILGSKPTHTVETAAETSADDNWETFPCDECDVVLTTQEDLDTHKTTHSFLVPRPVILKSSQSSTDSRSSMEDPIPVSKRQRATKSTAKVWNSWQETFPCDMCDVVLSTQNSLEDHKASHILYSRLIDNRKRSDSSSKSFTEDSIPERRKRQKAIKSTAKSSILNNTFPTTSYDNVQAVSDPDRLLCKHCDVRFPDETSLLKHTYDILPEKAFVCDICQQGFDTKMGLRGHRPVHFRKQQTKENTSVVDRTREQLQCSICPSYFKYPSAVIKHMSTCHNMQDTETKPTKFTGKHRKDSVQAAAKSSPKYRCKLCSQIFTTKYSMYKHKALVHPGYKQKNTYEKVHDTVVSTSQKKKVVIAKKQSGLCVPIPKQALFKCNKCQIHFVTCTRALEHSKRCVLAKGDWKCSKCRRSFTHMDRHAHTVQHEHTERFKVQVVSDKMLSKVICRCPKCELLFDEYAFKKHFSVGCKVVGGVRCDRCNLEMHPDAMPKHRKYHNKYGLVLADYIIVDFADVPSIVASHPNVDGKKVLYYCTICKSNSYTLKYKAFHHSQYCEGKSDTKNCTVCGLLFSFKIYLRHAQDHSENNYTLNDYTFIRIQDNRAINPPLPEFRKCDKCKVRFISLLAKKTHDCRKQKYVKCSKCVKKYEPTAYDIHLGFHEYGSLGNKTQNNESPVKDSEVICIYACVSCKYGFNTYDTLVEHCQNHFIDTQVLQTNQCKFCKLHFADDHDMNHRDVRVLKFNHDKLLQPEFFEGFDSVPKQEVDSILSKSMYGMTLNVRNVRLQLQADGPPERSLYKCAQCALCFDVNDVLEHTQSPCSKSVRYSCNSCTSEFPTKSTATKHNNIHVIFGDDINFREILFNKTLDIGLNEALRTGRKKESLKFRKCQHCELLIKKNEYLNHIEEHEKYKKCYDRYTIFMSTRAKTLYTVYRCITCLAIIIKRPNILRHNCSAKATSEKCSKCSLLVKTYFTTKHEKLHLSLPKFITKNITVLDFELHKNRNKVIKYTPKVMTKEKTYDTRKAGDKSYMDNTTDAESDEGENSTVKVGKSTDNTAVNDLNRWALETRNLLYQCHRCYMCFVFRNLLLDHLPKCNNVNETPLTCNSCDILFHPSLFAFHEMQHEATNRIPDYVIYLVNVSFTSDLMPWLYRCNTCDVHYITLDALAYHFSQKHKSATPYVECEICNLKFTSHTRTKHMALHEEHEGIGNQFNVEIIQEKPIRLPPKKISVEDHASSEGGVSIDEVTEGECETTDSVDKYNEESTNPNSSVCDEDETSNSKDENVEKSSEQQTYTLYKCISCNVHYINNNTLVIHMRRNYRVHQTESFKCKICNLDFGTNTLKKHVAFHHKNNKLNKFVIKTIADGVFFDDLYETVEINFDTVNIDEKENSIADTTQLEFENDTLEKQLAEENVVSNTDAVKAKYASSIDTDDLPLIRVENEAKKTIVIRLYQCKDCRVCMEKSQRVFHVCCSDLQKKHCITCSLAFRRNDFSHHMTLHRKHREISRKNYVLVKFGRRSDKNKIYKCVACSTHFVSIQALQWHMNVYNHQTKREYCEICGLFFGKCSLGRHVYIHHTKLNLSTDQFDIVSVSTDVPKLDEKKSIETSNIEAEVSDAPSKTFKKLFKCFECDVYFLTQIAYYKHMYNHVELDPTDYIACKMCYMQFLTEDLGVHMKTHRDKSFCLDNLMIEGYQPTAGSPRIESYLAVDNLNSKLVSTTTHSDNEEDAPSVEQLSTVDSTSAKLK